MAQQEISQDNLALWNAVVKTDPAYTKTFRRSGGFEGTAINFVYLARKATEQFGPMGLGWGAKILEEKYVPGHRLSSGDNAVIHVVRIELWYKRGGKRGSIEAYGQTTFIGEDKRGAFTDEEAPKKSLTDAMSKALSWLGFGADVHLGLYDDNKYVSELRKEFEPEKKVEQRKEMAEELVKALPLWKLDVANATNTTDLRAIWARIFEVCKQHQDNGGREAWAGVKALLEARAAELKQTERLQQSVGPEQADNLKRAEDKILRQASA